MADSKRVVIVGGGVIGLATAYYCLKQGHRVTVIDRKPARRDGCSFGNAGMIVPSHFIPLAAPGMVQLGLKWMWNPESPFYIKPRLSWDLLSWGMKFWRASTKEHVQRCATVLRDLHLASREAYAELSEGGIAPFDLTQRGLVMLCKDSHVLEEEAHVAKQAQKLGVPAEVLSAEEVSKLDPGVTMDVAGGVYYPRDCHLSPGKLMAGLEASLVKQGCQFQWESEVDDLPVEQGRVSAVHWRKVAGNETGREEADEVVIAGGSWTPLIAKKVRLSLPMQAGKGYSVTLAQPKELPELCSIFTEARVAVTPMGGTLRFGGTMEMSGLNETISPRRVQGILRAVPKYFPAFREEDFAGIAPWVGLRPCSPDGMPYIGRTKRLANLIVATGHAMMGLSLAPVTGKIVAGLVSGDRGEMDLSTVSPDRYS